MRTKNQHARRFELEEDIVGFDEDTKYIKRQVFDISLTARVALSVVGTGDKEKTKSSQYLSVTENVNDHISLNCSTTKLRSLVIYPNEGFQRTPAVTTPGAKFLRVLDLQKLPFEHLPKEIGDLHPVKVSKFGTIKIEGATFIYWEPHPLADSQYTRPARIHIEEENSRMFSNLISLFISETRLEKDEDIAMLASLADLQILRLRSDAFVGRVLVFPKGGFPRLQEIELYRLSTLEQWEVGDGAMPFLRELRLWNCINMRMLLLPEGLVRLTELNQIGIRGMKMIARRVDKESGEDYHKIKHIPCIEIN
ncbi:hypothetical protein ZIOFF_044935 [Zingiber officinale]|uniref:Uncharacterized protein n=1 Tax=Zingiber officinale TaxID=94328 RepID=A0A8J5KUU8_ZINOF|nr:hypothetical protein ZIOFF_044935 [Zingiber officinale]